MSRWWCQLWGGFSATCAGAPRDAAPPTVREPVNPANPARLWLSQAASGDPLAIQKLILLHHARLRPIAAQRMPAALREKLEPEDVLQEVYAAALRQFHRFEPRGPDAFFRWLVRILDSKLIDAQRRYRAAARDVRREAPGAAADTPSGYEQLAARVAIDSLTPSRVVAREELESRLLAALAGLSHDHRRVLELRFLRGRPLREVATEMQRSAAAVQMLCGRALRELRTALQRLSEVQ